MAMKSPQVSAQKWSRNLAASGESIRAGVQSVREAPTAKAAQSLDKALANYTDAVTSGRMARALQDVTLPAWQNAMVTKGLPRIQQGAQQGQGNYESFAVKFYPVAQAASEEAKSLPNNNINDALERVRRVITRFKQYAGKPV